MRRSHSDIPADERQLVIYGRSIRQLVIVWVLTVGALALIHYVEVSAPAFHELLIPFYWVIIAVGAGFTWRWLRSRSESDRRRSDRRRLFRRGGHKSSQAAAPAPEREEK